MSSSSGKSSSSISTLGDSLGVKKFSKEEASDGSSDHKYDKLVAAVFYGVSSLAVIFSNKAILTNYDFPYFNFLATVQFIATTLILGVLIYFNKIEVPWISMEVVKEVLPVSLMFLGNVICGLGSTKALNLPMFTALRRVSILMTMVAEVCFLNARPSHQIVFSIFMMVGGALVAALDDLSYDGWGYTLVLFNNLFTCLNGVWLKKAAISGRCSKMGVLFYNSLFSAVIMIAFFLFESLLLPTVYDHGILYSVLHLADTNSGGGAVAAVRRLLSEVTTNSGTNLRFIPDGSAAAAAAVTTTTAATMAAKQHGSAFGAALAAAGSSVSSSSTPAATVAAVSATAVKIAATQTTVGSTTAAAVQHLSTLQKVWALTCWDSWTFIFMFLAAAIMGCILNYSIFLCTTRNSALTTAVVGALKNVATAYIGMLVFADYSFSWVNFVGINISIAGSLYYTYITMFTGKAGRGG